jgi:competence protein ComEC
MQLGVHFLDVGQGDAIYIKAPNTNSLLIDSGPPNEKVITEIYKFKNIFERNISALLITHADGDHIGSMKKVIENFNYQAFLFSGLESNSDLFKNLMQTVNSRNYSDKSNDENKNNQIYILTAGMSLILDSERNIKFEVLFPDFEYQIGMYKKCIEKNSNNLNSKRRVSKGACLRYLDLETNLNSIVGKLSYGSTSFMLTGDAPTEVGKFLISKYDMTHVKAKEGAGENFYTLHSNRLDSDVLKLGHHGSKTSTSDEFMQSISPQYVVVSSGKDNRYGHPHKKVLDIIEKYRNDHPGFKGVLRTDAVGTISFYSDGSDILVNHEF